jgi:hypothetical protein
MSTFGAYSSKTIEMINFSQINVKDLRQINVERKRKVHIVCIYVYMMVNIVYTPYSSFSSKWVFTLVLLAEMRLDNFVFFSFSIHLYCNCQAQRLQWDATFDLLIVLSFFLFCFVLFLLLVWPFFISYIYIQRINLIRRRWRKEQKTDQTNMSIYAN